jgi:hypothetical protein
MALQSIFLVLISCSLTLYSPFLNNFPKLQRTCWMDIRNSCAAGPFTQKQYCRQEQNSSISILKGQCYEIFGFLFFHELVLPEPLWVSQQGQFKFCKNSRRYLQLKVHLQCRWHRWQMEKIFSQKSFNYFVWTPLVRRVNIYCRLVFSFKFNLRCQQSDEMTLMLFSGLGEDDSWKKPEAKISWHCPFNISLYKYLCFLHSSVCFVRIFV